MSNAVYIIKPYKLGALWVFDDERFGLNQEPFVGSTNRVIDILLARKGLGEARQFMLVFSQYLLPNADCSFVRKETVQHEKEQSAWYFDKVNQIDFWLCPAMNHYFGTPPLQIFVAVFPYETSKTEKIQRRSSSDRCQA